MNEKLSVIQEEREREMWIVINKVVSRILKGEGVKKNENKTLQELNI